MKNTRTKALFALAVVSLLWGTTWVASKEGVRYMPALQLAGIRQLIGGACYVLFFLLKGTRLPRGREWGPVFMLAFLNFALSNGLSTWGVKYISAGLGAIIGAIFPLWLVVITLFTTKVPLPAKAVFGLALGFAGICVIFFEHLPDFANPDFRFGIAISLVATLSWAFGTVYTKKHAVSFNPYFSLGLQMVISGLGVYGIAAGTGQVIPMEAIPGPSWLAILFLVLFSSIGAFAAYLYALQHLPTEQVSLYAYINPIVAILLGSFLFGEKLTPFIFTGSIITLYGVYLVNRTVSRIRSAAE